jgi:hypothetical protein
MQYCSSQVFHDNFYWFMCTVKCFLAAKEPRSVAIVRQAYGQVKFVRVSDTKENLTNVHETCQGKLVRLKGILMVHPSARLIFFIKLEIGIASK